MLIRVAFFNEAIMLANLIKQHAAVQASAGDFQAVAKILNEKTVAVYVGKVSGRETLFALVQAGIDPNEVIAAMRSVPMASELLDVLTVSGVDWSDDLTKYVMGGLVQAGKIKPEVVAVVVGLSTQQTSLAGRDVTAEECEAAWLVGADVLVMVNITDGVTALHVRVTRDGGPLKSVSLREGSGSPADQSLLTAIETAIDTYLAGE